MVSNFFNAPYKRVTFSLQKRKRYKCYLNCSLLQILSFPCIVYGIVINSVVRGNTFLLFISKATVNTKRQRKLGADILRLSIVVAVVFFIRYSVTVYSFVDVDDVSVILIDVVVIWNIYIYTLLINVCYVVFVTSVAYWWDIYGVLLLHILFRLILFNFFFCSWQNNINKWCGASIWNILNLKYKILFIIWTILGI